jgi:hypothetical protein
LWLVATKFYKYQGVRETLKKSATNFVASSHKKVAANFVAIKLVRMNVPLTWERTGHSSSRPERSCTSKYYVVVVVKNQLRSRRLSLVDTGVVQYGFIHNHISSLI